MTDFDEFVATHVDDLIRTAYLIVWDEAEAEDFNDLTEAQVADVLGCSPGTVKSSASRGLARLREALQPVHSNPGAPNHE